MRLSEPAPAKLNLALHVRGKRADGRHDLDTIFAFCTDGDWLHAEPAAALSLTIEGPFAAGLDVGGDNLVLRAAQALADAVGVTAGAALTLDKRLPVASGIGGGSADAGAALRLLTRLWSIDPSHAAEVAPSLGSDVPACLLSIASRGTGAGDELKPFELAESGAPVLLVNPLRPLSTAAVFSAWSGADGGEIARWQEGRNDLEAPARALVPEIGEVLDWLGAQAGAQYPRMSGSGATCFALFEDETTRDVAAMACPPEYWHLASFLR